MYISDDSDIECLREIILQKKLFRNQGVNVDSHCSLFEKKFSKLIGVSHCLMLTSGTNALICALQSLKIGKDDEVIVPAYTFFATIGAVVNVGARPILANVDEKLSIDSQDIEKKITSKTKAIIAVHIDGRPCDMDNLKAICSKHNLKLVEDVAQAIGGRYRQQYLGSIGDIGCFSFNVDKILSCGEGGAITLNERETYERSICIQDTSCVFGATFKNSFSEIKPFFGQSMRVSEISGALMNNQLNRLHQIITRLQERRSLIISHLKKYQINIIGSHDEEGDCGTSIYIQIGNPEKCKKISQQLLSQQVSCYPLFMRPGHYFKNWENMLAAHFGDYKINNSDFIKTIDYISSTLKINTPFEISLDECHKFSGKILSTIEDENL